MKGFYLHTLLYMCNMAILKDPLLLRITSRGLNIDTAPTQCTGRVGSVTHNIHNTDHYSWLQIEANQLKGKQVCLFWRNNEVSRAVKGGQEMIRNGI